MKETDCNKTQIFNPKSKRCVNKDSKKGIELLLKKKDKSILKLYELINGKVLKKCPEGKIRNLENLKCVKKDEIKKMKGRPKKEVLEEDKVKKTKGRPKKEVLEEDKVKKTKGRPKKEVLEENKVKKTKGRPKKEVLEEDKVKKSDKKITPTKDETYKYIYDNDIFINELEKKEKGNKSLEKKIEAVKKAKKILSPFLNRVSMDVYTRNRYLLLMKRELNKTKEKNKGCVKIYKEMENLMFQYRIGNNIILKKKIGTDSVYGDVYLSEFREKNKRLFTFVTKIYLYNEFKFNEENKILNKLTEIVRKGECPHFPITYGYVICENILEGMYEKDSYVKSTNETKSITQNLIKYPLIIKKELIRDNRNVKFISLFYELANGDLWSFIEKYSDDTDYLMNSLVQIYLAITFFTHYTNKIHTDTHPGNFLYHKVNSGGYLKYELFDEIYYVENLGFLWVIWDFDLSKNIEEWTDPRYIPNRKIKSYSDYKKIIKYYIPAKKFLAKNQKLVGYNDENLKLNKNKRLYDILYKLYNLVIVKYEGSGNDEEIDFKYNLYNLVFDMLEFFVSVGYIKKELPVGAKVINKEAYKLKHFLNRK